MKYRKITTGFVIQTYDGTKCIASEFVAGDNVEYENENGDPIDMNKDQEEYFGFDMVQPESRGTK